jgi:hypothetical protein
MIVVYTWYRSQRNLTWISLILGGCILLRPLLRPVWGCRQSQQFLFPYSCFYITTCFGHYRPSSGEIYTLCIGRSEFLQFGSRLCILSVLTWSYEVHWRSSVRISEVHFSFLLLPNSEIRAKVTLKEALKIIHSMLIWTEHSAADMRLLVKAK